MMDAELGNAPAPIRSVGEYVPMIDGPEKVSGRAKFTADIIEANALEAAILRSPYAHAELLEVDISKAAALPGVRAVITGDASDETHGILPMARFEHAIARDKVRYKGEPVAAVAADTIEIARQALDLIELKVRELPAYFSAADAMAEGAEQIHAHRKGNIERLAEFELGDVDAAFAEADLVREESYFCAEICQAQMETHAALADWDQSSERLTIRCTTQVPYYVHLMLAKIMKLEMAQIRVIKPYLGGGFGSRTEALNIEMIASLLAREAGAMVRLVTNREDTFITHRGRPESDLRLKLGLKADGTITGVELENIQRGGAHSSYGIVTLLYSGAMLYALYDLNNARYIGRRVLTNTPPCGAMRGHGSVKMRFAFESLLDQMAHEMNLDPLDVRRQNLLEAPTFTQNDMMINSYGLPECIDWVEQASDWKRKKKAGLKPLRPRTRRGIGFGCSHMVSGASHPVNWTGEPHATVNIKLDFDGAVTVLTGAPEIGQGSSTVMAQIAADVLGLPMKRVRVVAGDSELTPKDNGAYSSRITFMVGNATQAAATELRRILVEAAARKLEADPDDIEVLGEVYRAGAQDKGLTFKEVVREALTGTGTITAKGTFDTIPESHGGKKYRGAAVGGTMGFSYAAQAVEVTVDEDTGMVTVDEVWVAEDCGRAINRLTVEGQIQGAVWMAMGQTLSEEARYHNGLQLHANLLDYRIPTIQDSPPIHTHIVESIDPYGPFGAKEASEGAFAGFLGACANAIADAIGVRFTELPITPDKVFAALERRGR